jgi:hypothetical protein
MFLSTVPFLYSKRTAAARSPGSRLSTIDRFVAVSSTLAVELPTPSLSDLEILVTCLSVDGPRRIYNCPVRARRRARVRDPLSLVISVRDRASARTVTVHAACTPTAARCADKIDKIR